MIRVLFVCHGNICRSPMAEFLFLDLVRRRGLTDFYAVESAATSTEEIGNPVHQGTAKILNRCGIDCGGKRARQMVRADGQRFDWIVGMDRENMRHIRQILDEKATARVAMLLDFTDHPGEVADPWYTMNFEATYQDVTRGCAAFLDVLEWARTQAEENETHLCRKNSGFETRKTIKKI